MQEMWGNTAQFYKRQKRLNALCKCLDQVFVEQINTLHIAKQIRDPEQMYYVPAGSNMTRKAYFYTFVYGGALQPAHRNGGQEQAYQNIVDESTWETWKNITSGVC